MAQVVNTDTTLGRRAALHRAWLVVLVLAALLLTASFARLLVRDLGEIKAAGVGSWTSIASNALSRAFTPGTAQAHSPETWRRLIMLGLHLLGLAVIGQVIWAPLAILRSHRGEQQVLQELRRLPRDYWVLNDLLVPGAQRAVQVDHVVVSPYGIWCLETKAERGHVSGGEYDYEWRLGRRPGATGAANAIYNPVRQNTIHCDLISNYLMLRRLDAPVRSMIVFTAAQLELMTMTRCEKLGCAASAILDTDAAPVLEERQVQKVVGALSSLLAIKTTSPEMDAALRAITGSVAE